jgi:threonine/homoserine/homoserine lactone efflux protein
MFETLPTGPMLAAFFVASLVLAVTPGPAVIYVVARTVAHGRRAGLASVAGVALGNLGNAIGAALGLAALFALSSLAFTLVKYAGAAYLVYLGVKALRGRSKSAGTHASPVEAPSPWMVFRDGFMVALLNPKTALFFAAFLPQFMDPALSPIAQTVWLGSTFVLIAATTDIAYVLIAGAASRSIVAMKGARTLGRYATAGVFIGLGVYTAASGSRTPQ